MRPRRIKLILGCLLILPLAFYFLPKSHPCTLAVPRFGHSATLLKDGRILVSGGQTGFTAWVPFILPPWVRDRLPTYPPITKMNCEILDTRTWHWHVCDSSQDYQGGGSALLLNDGRVLRQLPSPMISSYLAEPQIFDPVAETWRPATGSPKVQSHRCLVMSGPSLCLSGPAYPLWVDRETAEWKYIRSGVGFGPISAWAVQLDDRTALFEGQKVDVPTDTWTPTGPMHMGHKDGQAVMLVDGRVLVSGGIDSTFAAESSAELYDPKTGTWSTTGSMNVSRVFDTATVLPNGTVLVTGGRHVEGRAETSCEIYHPSTGQWTLTGSLNVRRMGHTATLLPSGKVLVIGGADALYTGEDQVFRSCELYDPVTGTWTEL